MLTQRQLEKIADTFGKRMEKIVQQYLQAMGEHIRDIGKLLPSDVQKLVEMRRMGVNIETIQRGIKEALGDCKRDVGRVFRETAEADYRAERALFGDDFNVPFSQNDALMRTLNAYVRQTSETLSNLSNTTVVSSAYREAVDRAVQAAQSGVTDYASAVRQALREAAAGGLRVQYASGATRRLDSAVRMNVLDGVRQLNQDIAMQTGKEYGADGVELSAHALCAEDHLPYQGKQFSFKEFERLQAQLERPIGMWNCRHFAFPIILGVSEPANSKELLENYRRTSQERITIDGVTKTRYEWTQQQRKLETAVRRQKDIANTAKAAGDDVLRREAQYKIERYQAAYDRITDKAMLTADRSRMRVSGFRSVKPLKPDENSGIIDINKTPDFLAPKGQIISKEYQNKLRDAFNNASEEAKRAYMKYVPNGGAVENGKILPEWEGWYDPSSNKITMNFEYDARNPMGAGHTWFHEHGHLVDYSVGRISKDNEFEAALRMDYEHTILRVRRENNIKPWQDMKLVDCMRLEIEKANSTEGALPIVSDLYGAMSSNAFMVRYGHNNAYWAKPGSLTDEAFANFFEAEFSPKEVQERLKDFFPESLEYFKKLLRRVAE